MIPEESFHRALHISILVYHLPSLLTITSKDQFYMTMIVFTFEQRIYLLLPS